MNERQRFWVKNVFMLLIAVLFFACMLLVDVDNPSGPLDIALISLLCAALLGWFGWQLAGYFRRIRRLRREQAEEEWDETPENLSDSILYLRPFMVDHRKITPINYGGDMYASVEAVLCEALKKSGRPVAIGIPGEQLQPLGAKRIYATDETWKDTVSAYLDKAQHVVLYADFTPGVVWEIEQTMARVRDKLILIPRVYNRQAGLLRYPLMGSVLTMLYPLYKLIFDTLWIPRLRRGRKYYREWDRTLGPHLNGLRLTDRISAIVFEGGKPVPFYAANGSIEAQMDAILRAVTVSTASDNIRQAAEPGRKIRFVGSLAASAIADAALFPMGNVHLEPQGLRFRASFLILRMMPLSYIVWKYRFRRIAYGAIQRIERRGQNELLLQVEGVNKSLRLTIPFWNAGDLADVEAALYARGACGRTREDDGAAEAQLHARAAKQRRLVGVAAGLLLLAGVAVVLWLHLLLGCLLLAAAYVVSGLYVIRPLNWISCAALMYSLWRMMELLNLA